MHTPSPLVPGNRIHIAQVAGPVELSKILRATSYLEQLGFRVSFDSRMQAQGYLAGSDESRLEDFVSAMRDPDVSMVIAARGGYGTMRILDQIPSEIFRDSPKWICGFSDITALHLRAAAAGLVSIHGPNAGALPTMSTTRRSWQAAAAGTPDVLHGTHAVVLGKTRGRLVGGNLTMVAAMVCASPIDWSQCILLLEDINEELYRIDRSLSTLRLAGILGKVKGIVLGQFRAGTDREILEAGVSKLLVGSDCPVLAGVDVGHDAPNLSFFHGHIYDLDTNAFALVPAPALVLAPTPDADM